MESSSSKLRLPNFCALAAVVLIIAFWARF